MRIIGGHDFYDSALAYGHDEQIVFLRENGNGKHLDEKVVKALGLRHRRIDLPQGRRGSSNWWKCVSVIIGDKHYAGICYTAMGKISYEDHYAWSKDAYEKLLKMSGESVERYTMSKFARRMSGVRNYMPFGQKEQPVDYFTPVPVKAETRQHMIDNRISILVSTDRDDGYYSSKPGTWSVNPDTLKELDFAKCIDPYTLFQELDMWISGVLGMAANPMVEVSNDVKVHKHGFDKFSFRKPKAAS